MPKKAWFAMRRPELLNLLNSRPFHPFRIYMSDGAVFMVKHPELVMLTSSAAHVGVTMGDEPAPVVDRVNIVDLAHITRLEPIEPATAES
jgi:hypothetical protein